MSTPPRRWMPPWASRVANATVSKAAAIIDPVVAAAAAAALCAVAVHRLEVGVDGQAAEVPSEVVCWVLLGLVVAGLRRWGLGTPRWEGEGWELVEGGESPGLEGGEGESQSQGLGKRAGGRVASAWSLGVVALALGVASAAVAEVGALLLFVSTVHTQSLAGLGRWWFSDCSARLDAAVAASGQDASTRGSEPRTGARNCCKYHLGNGTSRIGGGFCCGERDLCGTVAADYPVHGPASRLCCFDTQECRRSSFASVYP